MNEIHHIHLGRQAYTIAVDAYKELQDYLSAIQKEVGKEVADEVELRMSELLAERGIVGKKVVLHKDVEYLKEQLGTPGDFSDSEAIAGDEAATEANTTKRLFRNTDQAMVAGVCAGLAEYFGVDVLVVRLLFAALILFGGGGFLLYIVLWLLVPEAKTSTERLQMQGKPVTVEAIKQAVSRADVQGATRRVSHVLGKTGETVGKCVLAIVGIAFMLGAFGMLVGTAGMASYLLGHGLDIGNLKIFPVGQSEVLLVACGLVLATLLSSIFVVVGQAIMRRKWSMPGWSIAAMALLFLCVISTGTTLGFKTAPQIQARYLSVVHTQNRPLPAFTSVHINGDQLPVSFRIDTTYHVEFHIAGAADTKTITTTVKDSVLDIDDSSFNGPATCHLVCPYGDRNVEIVVYAPTDVGGVVDDGSMKPDWRADTPQAPETPEVPSTPAMR